VIDESKKLFTFIERKKKKEMKRKIAAAI